MTSDIVDLHWTSMTTGNPIHMTVRWNRGNFKYEVTMTFNRAAARAGSTEHVTFTDFKAWKGSIIKRIDPDINAETVLDQFTEAVLENYLKTVVMT